MVFILSGTLDDGYGAAGKNLMSVLPLIEARSGLHPLIPNTLNLKLARPYPVAPDFVITANEYNGSEELRFRHCTVADWPGLIMRPDSHENGAFHGPAYLEIMSTAWLRKELKLQFGSVVNVEIP